MSASAFSKTTHGVDFIDVFDVASNMELKASYSFWYNLPMKNESSVYFKIGHATQALSASCLLNASQPKLVKYETYLINFEFNHCAQTFFHGRYIK